MTGRGVSDWPMHTILRYRASVNALVRRTIVLAAPVLATAAFAPLPSGWYCPSLIPHYGERGWRGGGINDRLHKRSIFAIGGQGIASLSSPVRLTI